MGNSWRFEQSGRYSLRPDCGRGFDDVLDRQGDVILRVQHGYGERARSLLLKVRDLNDRQRRYTDAARAVAEINAIPGVLWANEIPAPECSR